jgi:O-antigen ligase
MLFAMKADPGKSRRKGIYSTDPAAIPSAGLFWFLVVYLVVSFYRFQDNLLPFLAALAPGLLSTAGVLFFWISHKDKRYLRDPLITLQLTIATVMFLGLIGVANHYWWYRTVQDYVVFFIAFSLGLPAVMQYAPYRETILRVLLGSFLFAGLWTISHGGIGPGGWMQDENDTAIALIVGLCLAVAVTRSSATGIWRIVAIATALACSAGIVITESRGGFIGLVAALVAIAAFSGRKLKTILWLGLLAVIVLPFVPQTYKSQVTSITDSSDGTRTERIYSWRRAWHLTLRNPVIGVGPGNFPWSVGEVEDTREAIEERGDRRSIAGRAAHSLYFTLLPELGAVGTVAYLAACWLVLRRAWAIYRSTPSRDAFGSIRTVGLWVGPALIGFSAAAAFASVLWYPLIWLFFGLAVLMGPFRLGTTAALPTSNSASAPPIAGLRDRRHSARRNID